MSRKPPSNFEMLEIPVGATLTFKNQEDIICEVTKQDPPQVRYKGDVVSVTEAAKRARGNNGDINGNIWWMYEGELLTNRRKRMEEEMKVEDDPVQLGKEFDVMDTGLESPDSEGEASQRQVHGTDEEYVQKALSELEKLVPVLYRLETERLSVRQSAVKCYFRCIDVLPERLQRQVEILLRL